MSTSRDDGSPPLSLPFPSSYAAGTGTPSSSPSEEIISCAAVISPARRAAWIFVSNVGWFAVVTASVDAPAEVTPSAAVATTSMVWRPSARPVVSHPAVHAPAVAELTVAITVPSTEYTTLANATPVAVIDSVWAPCKGSLPAGDTHAIGLAQPTVNTGEVIVADWLAAVAVTRSSIIFDRLHDARA